MDQEEFLRRHDFVRTTSSKLAEEHVRGLNLPDRVDIDLESIKRLGFKFHNRSERMYSSLADQYEDALPLITGYAIKHMWLSLWEGAYYFKEGIKCGLMGDNEYCRSFTTADGYGNNEGFANTLYGGLSEVQLPPIVTFWRSALPPHVPINISDTLSALFLHFLEQASKMSPQIDPTQYTNLLYEAADALALAEGDYMWNSSKEHHLETQEQGSRSTFAKLGAAARHAENRAMKKEVHDWLDANMANFKSMDKAAEAIAGKISPVSFRTARDWVGEWKKLRAPGRA